MWNKRKKPHDKKSPRRGESSSEVVEPRKLEKRIRSAPTLTTPNAVPLLEEEEGSSGRVLSRSQSYDSSLFNRSKGGRRASSSSRSPRRKIETQSEKSVRLRSQRGLPGPSGVTSRRDSHQSDPVSCDSTSSGKSSRIENEDLSDESKDTNVATNRTEFDRETSSSKQVEYAPSEGSESVVSYEVPTLSVSEPGAASSQNIYEEQAKIKVAKGFSTRDIYGGSSGYQYPEKGSPNRDIQRHQRMFYDDVVSEAHQGSSRIIQEPQRVYEGAIPKQSTGVSPKKPYVPPLQLSLLPDEEYPLRLGPMEPRHESSPITTSQRNQPISNLCEGDNRPVFLDVLRANRDVIILTKKKHGEVTVFVLMPNPLRTDFINVYLLVGRVMKPLTSMYATPPYNAHCLSALVAELQNFLPRESIFLSEWAVIDREMAAASAQIFAQNPEIAPVTLFSLLAERLFTNTESMLNFFEHHYVAYREEQLALARQQLNRDVLEPGEIAKIESQIAGIALKGPLTEEQKAHEEKQRRYIQTLKPPINIPPLPPRPQRELVIRKPPEDDTKQLARQPPTTAELAALQACYERDGRPKVKSQPRQIEPSDSEEERKEEE